VVADDIDPKVTTIEEVESVITGDFDIVDGELTAINGEGAAPVN
jgi:hypothetical protein